MTVDGYIRVSRVGGRAGESFISPDEQRKAIEAYATAHRLELGEWFTDLDQGSVEDCRRAFTRHAQGKRHQGAERFRGVKPASGCRRL